MQCPIQSACVWATANGCQRMSNRSSIRSTAIPFDLHARIGGAKPNVTSTRVDTADRERCVQLHRMARPEASPKATRDVRCPNCRPCLPEPLFRKGAFLEAVQNTLNFLILLFFHIRMSTFELLISNYIYI